MWRDKFSLGHTGFKVLKGNPTREPSRKYYVIFNNDFRNH